ncbi:etoposide-induced protein 2.4 homolog [Macrosteles quadrilineatus]|uniref:etoposide-induced protein 2.4 homolog n=1 Tax=Macrosteles quadrilineatus TaxID=74068 RepID=UPI0023E1D242|nr:etoposide-induced protein 2.4 homolog [Macrosteles quadrilineatus]
MKMDMFIGILKAIFFGLVDSLKGTIVIFYLDKKIKQQANQRSPFKDVKNDGTPKRRSSNLQTLKKQEEPKILQRTLQCCLLNGGVFWFSLVLFEYVLLPTLRQVLYMVFGPSSATGRAVWSWMEPFLHLTFSTFWVLPIFLLSKVVNALWFQDIADSAYRHTRGTPQQFSSISKLVADTLFSVLVQFLFLAQTTLVGLLPIPVLAEALSLVHMCLLYSLYSFEYKWFNMGWELHRRLTYIENNWPYFIGFGLPLAVLTGYHPSYIISGCIFSILFPLFIISGNEADPVTNVCDTRLKLFSPVITISNALFNRTIGTRAVIR